MQISPDLCSAIDADDCERLKRILDQNVDLLKSVDETGNGLLHLASGSNRIQCIDFLLAFLPIVEINKLNSFGRSPLHLAAFFGCALALDRLLHLDGIDVEIETHNGCTALYFACCRGHPSLVKMLISKGAVVNTRTKASSTPLIAASVFGDILSVSALLEAGAKPNTSNNRGMTALHCAAESGYRDIMNLLISKGGDPGIADGEGRTAENIWSSSQNKRLQQVNSPPPSRSEQCDYSTTSSSRLSDSDHNKQKLLNLPLIDSPTICFNTISRC